MYYTLPALVILAKVTRIDAFCPCHASQAIGRADPGRFLPSLLGDPIRVQIAHPELLDLKEEALYLHAFRGLATRWMARKSFKRRDGIRMAARVGGLFHRRLRVDVLRAHSPGADSVVCRNSHRQSSRADGHGTSVQTKHT